jgi:hypothetical protein
MNPIVEAGTLDFGVEIDGKVHAIFALSTLRLVDTYRAIEAVPVPDGIDQNLALRVAYETRLGDATILSQLTQLGTLDPVPSIEALMGVIEPDDMEILRAASAALKKKWRKSRQGSSPIGEPSSSSSAPGTT